VGNCNYLKQKKDYRINLTKNIYYDLENFSGKTVKQDFHAKVFLLTPIAAYAHQIEEKVKKEYRADKQRKYYQKTNRTNSISMTKCLSRNKVYKIDEVVLFIFKA